MNPDTKAAISSSNLENTSDTSPVPLGAASGGNTKDLLATATGTTSNALDGTLPVDTAGEGVKEPPKEPPKGTPVLSHADESNVPVGRVNEADAKEKASLDGDLENGEKEKPPKLEKMTNEGNPKSQSMKIRLGFSDDNADVGFDLQEHNSFYQLFHVMSPNLRSLNSDGSKWVKKEPVMHLRRYVAERSNKDESSTGVLAGEELRERTVLIYGIPEDCNELDILEAVREFGSIFGIRLIEQPDSGRFLGMILCEFVSSQTAAKCLQNCKYEDCYQYPASSVLHRKIAPSETAIFIGALRVPENIFNRMPVAVDGSMDLHSPIDHKLLLDMVLLVLGVCSGEVCKTLNTHFKAELTDVVKQNERVVVIENNGDEKGRRIVRDSQWLCTDIQNAIKSVVNKNANQVIDRQLHLLTSLKNKQPATIGRLNKKRTHQEQDTQLPKVYREN